MKTGYMVADIMTSKPITMTSSVTVQEVAVVMRDEGVGSMLLLDDNEIVGILTERDIINKVTCKNLDTSKTNVKHVMTPRKDMVFIEPGVDIYEAIVIMKDNHVRRLPVLENGKLKGLITRNDILKIEPDLFDIMVEKISLREEKRKLDVEGYDESADDDEP